MATISIGTPADKARLLHTLVLGFSAGVPILMVAMTAFLFRRASHSVAGRRERPAAVLDMGGLADNAFDQKYFPDRPADRRHLLGIQAVAAIVGA